MIFNLHVVYLESHIKVKVFNYEKVAAANF